MFLEMIYGHQLDLLPYLKTYADTLPPRTRKVHSLKKALRDDPCFSVIAEFKRRSPTRHILHPHASVKMICDLYEETQATAYSVLTESRFFGGLYTDLKHFCDTTKRPVLNKDFFIAPIQIEIAHKLGADCILLLAALSDRVDLDHMIEKAHALGLEVLMEIHDLSEFEKIKHLPFDILGINNRNLKSLTTDLTSSMQLITDLPPLQVPLITESGIQSPQDAIHLANMNFDGALIGTCLMSHHSPKQVIATIRGGLLENTH